jgi:cellulose synthase/poly-beta-1,6-N-acetylglucosamine synthase-like glycosyltransferase
MTLSQGLLCGVLLLGFLYWIATCALGLRALATMPVLADLRPADPPRWPSLSLIIPACNEADTIEGAVASRRAQDYPDLEIVLVEDRSTDATPALVDKIAAEDARVRALHIKELPAGWLGKLHALHQGARAARGEWLLFTDADVHFAPETLRKAIAYCEERGLDFLTVMPEFRPVGLLVDTAVSMFVRMVAGAAQVRSIEDPASRAAVGGGVFNLVRRSTFERTPGFEWLKLEVADDVAFGQMVKRSGARCSVVNARGKVALDFYESITGMARGCEKAGFAVVGRFSQLRLIASAAALFALEVSPLAAALLPHGLPWLRAIGALMLGVALLGTAIINRGFGRSMWSSLLPALGALLMTTFFLRSGYLAWRRGGVMWRGTIYPTSVLRGGSRLELPWERA